MLTGPPHREERINQNHRNRHKTEGKKEGELVRVKISTPRRAEAEISSTKAGPGRRVPPASPLAPGIDWSRLCAEGCSGKPGAPERSPQCSARGGGPKNSLTLCLARAAEGKALRPGPNGNFG